MPATIVPSSGLSNKKEKKKDDYLRVPRFVCTSLTIHSTCVWLFVFTNCLGASVCQILDILHFTGRSRAVSQFCLPCELVSGFRTIISRDVHLTEDDYYRADNPCCGLR